MLYVSLRSCACLCLRVHDSGARLRVFAYVCVRLQVSVRARVVSLHACAHPCLCDAFSRGCATIPGHRLLGRNKIYASNSLNNKDEV